MRILISFLATASLAVLLLFSPTGAVPTDSLHKRATLDDWIATETPIALQGVLNNLGPDGFKAPGAAAGILVASPSTSNPNCILPSFQLTLSNPKREDNSIQTSTPGPATRP